MNTDIIINFDRIVLVEEVFCASLSYGDFKTHKINKGLEEKEVEARWNKLLADLTSTHKCRWNADKDLVSLRMDEWETRVHSEDFIMDEFQEYEISSECMDKELVKFDFKETQKAKIEQRIKKLQKEIEDLETLSRAL